MSQPSYPIRCAKKAVIKTDDLLPVLGLKQEEKYRQDHHLILLFPIAFDLLMQWILTTFSEKRIDQLSF